jgi:ComF family protein
MYLSVSYKIVVPQFLKWLLNVFFPRTCAGCRGDVPWGEEHALCAACRDALPRWVGWACIVCDLPLPDGGARCPDCRRRRRAFRYLRSALLYEGAAGKIIKAFKFGGRQDLAGPLGRIVSDRWREEPRLGPADLVVPVPLHWRRERSRGYNQAAALARVFAGQTGLPMRADVLKRRRATKPQTSLGREDRRENVREAFVVRRPEAVRGKTVLLVDDVCTTGATLEACARALKKSGARRVGAITAARQAPF